MPGTNMTFAGVPRGSERADLIAYLNTHVRQSRAAAEGGESLPRRGAGSADAGADRAATPTPLPVDRHDRGACVTARECDGDDRDAAGAGGDPRKSDIIHLKIVA